MLKVGLQPFIVGLIKIPSAQLRSGGGHLAPLIAWLLCSLLWRTETDVRMMRDTVQTMTRHQCDQGHWHHPLLLSWQITPGSHHQLLSRDLDTAESTSLCSISRCQVTMFAVVIYYCEDGVQWVWAGVRWWDSDNNCDQSLLVIAVCQDNCWSQHWLHNTTMMSSLLSADHAGVMLSLTVTFTFLIEYFITTHTQDHQAEVKIISMSCL